MHFVKYQLFATADCSVWKWQTRKGKYINLTAHERLSWNMVWRTELLFAHRQVNEMIVNDFWLKLINAV